MAEQGKKSAKLVIGKWIRDLRAEVKKVVWPSPKQVYNNTVIVLITIALIGAFVSVFDIVFIFVRDFFMKTF